MQRKRIVYSSLDANRSSQAIQQKPRSKNRKRKQNKNNLNNQLANAARVYLRQLKLFPKHQIQFLLKSARFPHKQFQSLTTKRLIQQRYRNQEEIVKSRTKQTKESKIKSASKKKSEKYFNKLQLKLYKTRYGIRQSSFIGSSRKVENLEENQGTPRIQRVLKSRQYETEQKQFQKSKKQIFRYDLSQQNQNTQFTQLQKVYLSHRKFKKQQKPVQSTNNNASLSAKKDLTDLRSNDSFQSFKTLQNNQRLFMRGIKGYVINQRNEMISKFLQEQGWKRFSQNTERYTLKWTYNDSIKDYQILRAAERENKQMYFNHINNNKLIKKDDFHTIVKCLQVKGIQTSNFVPQTFLIGAQKSQFIDSYQFHSIFTCLRKHYEYIQLKKHLLSSKTQHRLSSIEDFLIFITKLKDEQAQNQIISCQKLQQFVVNIPLLYNLLIICSRQWIIQSNNNNQTQYVKQFSQKFTNLCNDKSVFQGFNAINKADLQFQQYYKIRYSSSKKRQFPANKNKQISIINGYLKMVKTFITPCKIFIQAVSLFYEYFSNNFKQKIMGGLRNFWIIKPCTGSKGSGIQIVDKIDRINQIAQSSSTRIVQKYIQNIWTLKPEQFEKLDSYSKSQYKFLVNKKFDIRQWVLLTTFGSYIFSSFYIRVCSEQYNLDSLNNQYSHLSNFSINHQNYSNPQESVINQQQFLNLLLKLGRIEQFYQTRKKIQQRTRLLIDQALLKCQKITGTFQVLGFDIIIDQQFNPWIIQCNMSPACNLRTEWLKQMKMCMMIGTLKTILDENTLILDSFQNNLKYTWIELSKNTQKRRKKLNQKIGQLMKSKQMQSKMLSQPIKVN